MLGAVLTWEPGIGPLLQIHVAQRAVTLCFCHHLPDRCVPFFGIERYLCSRCIGILLGGILGFIAWKAGISIPLPIAVSCLIPCILDGITQLFGMRVSSNRIRLSTGFLFGFGLNLLGGFV